MKKLLSLSMLLIAHIVCSAVDIRLYTDADKDAVMQMVFQDPMSFFSGSAVVQKGFMAREIFESESKKTMEFILNDPLRIKRVLVDDFGTVIGFVEFFKTKEMSLESVRGQVEAQGLPFDEQQMLIIMPQIKLTEAECFDFIEFESLVVEKDFRGKGFGKLLIQAVESIVKEQWPTINVIQLNVNNDNEVARNCYVSQGFEEIPNQSPIFEQMEIVQYKKIVQ